jgi:hypothetical protein
MGWKCTRQCSKKPARIAPGVRCRRRSVAVAPARARPDEQLCFCLDLKNDGADYLSAKSMLR